MNSFENNTILFLGFLLSVFCVSGYTYKEEPIAPGWANKKADIYFLVDSSNRIFSDDFKTMAIFVSDLVNRMDIGPNKTRVGLGLYAKTFEEYLPLNNDRSKQSLVRAIWDTSDNLKGFGDISKALEGLKKTGLSLNVARRNVPRVAVLLSEGPAFKNRQWTLDCSRMAKKDRIFLYTVAIGDDADKDLLRNIASDPKDNFVFQVRNFRSFNRIRDSLLKSMAAVKFKQKDESKCGSGNDTDVLFVFNEYGMGQGVAQAVKGFIKGLVKGLSVDSGHVRVGVFSKTCHTGDINLGQYLNRDELAEHIDGSPGPSIVDLMKTARNTGFSTDLGARVHAKQRIVLFLYGDIPEEGLKNEARRAKRNGKEVFIVDINAKYSKGSLEIMASDKSYIVNLESVEQLDSRKAEISQAFCNNVSCCFQSSTNGDETTTDPTTTTTTNSAFSTIHPTRSSTITITRHVTDFTRSNATATYYITASFSIACFYVSILVTYYNSH